MNGLEQIIAELLGLRTLAANLVTAGVLCAAHQLGYVSCGCDQGTPSDAWKPNVEGRLPPQLCSHASWSRKARYTWQAEDPPEMECDTCGTRVPAAPEVSDVCVVARCPLCAGWTMFHSRPDSATAKEWAALCENDGDVVVREIVGASLGPACEESYKRAAKRTCTPPTLAASPAPSAVTFGAPMSTVHLLIDGYRRIACSDGDGVPHGDEDTSTVAKVTCRTCLDRGIAMAETTAEAIAARLIELGAAKL
jgi:hypothetical protein